MKKILFVTTRDIYPINDGRRVVIYNYCKGLVEQLNCEVRLFVIENVKERVGIKPTFISKIYYGNKPNRLEKIKNLIIKSLLLNLWPLQVSVYYSKKTNKYLKEILKEYNPSTVICDMARTAEYLKDLDGVMYNKILDMDDLLSKRYKRQFEKGAVTENAIGAYSDSLPSLLRRLSKNKIINKIVLRKESRLLEKYEIYIARYFKKIIFVSPIEVSEFNERIYENKCIEINIGVDYEYFSDKVIQNTNNNYIVFLGNMYVAHNKDAVDNFLINIFPIILKQMPKCILRIVGRCPEEYRNYLNQFDNVEVTGEVDDIRKYVQECAVSVAPLVYGTGIKTKILESMAMGKPVVTNSIGVEGIEAINYEEIIVEDSYVDFAKETIKLLENSSYNYKISEGGRIFIKKNHLWNNIVNKFDDIIF